MNGPARGVDWVVGSQLLRVNRRADPPFRYAVRDIFTTVQRGRLRRMFYEHEPSLLLNHRHELKLAEDHWAVQASDAADVTPPPLVLPRSLA